MFGLLLLIGALGLSPWLTAFTFLRNWHLVRLVSAECPRPHQAAFLSLAGLALLTLVPGLAIHNYGERLVGDVIRDPGSEQAVERVRGSMWWLAPSVPAIARAWRAERDPDRYMLLLDAYYEITGWDLEMELPN